MLSNKIKNMSKDRGWWYDGIAEDYINALLSLDIDCNSDFALFYLHIEDGPTFYSRNQEILHICWFIINSDYSCYLEFTHETLKLPIEYIPLSSFEGEGGYFYNRKTDEVIFISLGESLVNFLNNRLKPQWKNFSLFIEWYFELNN